MTSPQGPIVKKAHTIETVRHEPAPWITPSPPGRTHTVLKLKNLILKKNVKKRRQESVIIRKSKIQREMSRHFQAKAKFQFVEKEMWARTAVVSECSRPRRRMDFLHQHSG